MRRERKAALRPLAVCFVAILLTATAAYAETDLGPDPVAWWDWFWSAIRISIPGG